MPISAALAAEYGTSHEAPTCPHMEEILIMRPHFWRIICGSAALQHKNAPRTCTAIISSHSAAVTSVNNFCSAMPALFTRISGSPNEVRTFWNKAATLASLCTSSSNGAAVPPCPAISRHTCRASSCRVCQHTATRHPAAANARAAARPMPREAPVTTAVFSILVSPPACAVRAGAQKTGPAGRRILAPTGRFPPSAHG